VTKIVGSEVKKIEEFCNVNFLAVITQFNY